MLIVPNLVCAKVEILIIRSVPLSDGKFLNQSRILFDTNYQLYCSVLAYFFGRKNVKGITLSAHLQFYCIYYEYFKTFVLIYSSRSSILELRYNTNIRIHVKIKKKINCFVHFFNIIITNFLRLRLWKKKILIRKFLNFHRNIQPCTESRWSNFFMRILLCFSDFHVCNCITIEIVISIY